MSEPLADFLVIVARLCKGLGTALEVYVREQTKLDKTK
jgi:hypothetical protein